MLTNPSLNIVDQYVYLKCTWGGEDTKHLMTGCS